MANAAKMEGPKNPPTGGAVPLPKSKRGVKAFFADVMRELKKVTWPKPSETNRMTGVVMAVCLLVVIILTAMSYLVDTIMKLLTTGQV
jgi:preprotein translocase SecE subunit